MVYWVCSLSCFFFSKKFDRIKEGMRSILNISLSYSIFIGVLLWFTGHSLSAVFLDGRNEAVLSLAEQYFKIHSPFYLFLALIFVLRPSLQGLGNSFAPTFASAMELIARVFGAITLSEFFGYRNRKSTRLNSSHVA